jgi:uncharacterized membrane protein YgdD (TMEM256/DUF423 family)/AcrR family transcriptional regulator
MRSNFIAFAALNGALAVAGGAFAAHGLDPVADAQRIGWLKTASEYQVFHALAILANAALAGPRLAAWSFAAGIVFFSGALYGLALGGPARRRGCVHCGLAGDVVRCIEETDMTDTDMNIINAAFALAVEKGWAKVHLHEIAHRAGVTLADLYDSAPTKQAVLCLFERQINETVMRTAVFSADSTETPRERLFEVLMARFDALKPFKPGLKVIAGDGLRDPGSIALLAALLPPSMAWMLETAGIPADGLMGPGKVLGLTALYLQVYKTWSGDESEDSARTMADLDRRLKKAEGWAKSFGG